MSEIILPRWDGRFDVTRAGSTDFSDAAHFMVTRFNFFERIYEGVSPYEARQRQIEVDGSIREEEYEFKYDNYTPPSVEYLRSVIRQGVIDDTTYNAAMQALHDFCAKNRCKFALPVPHPTTIHSIQAPKGTFLIKKIDNRKCEVSFLGIKKPFIIEGLREPQKVQHLVLRPKSSSSGVANLNKWELLTFEEYQGYIPLWVDSTANPRFAGMV